MSMLVVHGLNGETREVCAEHPVIASRLKAHGVRFERWEASRQLAEDATQEEVIGAYQAQVDSLTAEYGFKSVDVVSVRPDHPQRAELRNKFLDEHVHGDFEVRFFVEGSGLFYLHIDDEVYAVLCEQGDLISVPAGTLHWFDMGETPDFKCIRLFIVPEGWVADFSGSDIAGKFPGYDRFVEAHQ